MGRDDDDECFFFFFEIANLSVVSTKNMIMIFFFCLFFLGLEGAQLQMGEDR